MSSEEEAIFKIILQNADNYISEIEKKNQERTIKKYTCEKKFIFWGFSNYRSTINNILSTL